MSNKNKKGGQKLNPKASVFVPGVKKKITSKEKITTKT